VSVPTPTLNKGKMTPGIQQRGLHTLGAVQLTESDHGVKCYGTAAYVACSHPVKATMASWECEVLVRHHALITRQFQRFLPRRRDHKTTRPTGEA